MNPFMHSGPNFPLPVEGFILFGLVALIVTLWSLVWKALAVWHAARNRQKIWFVALLLIHTWGILDIIYLVWFKKNGNVAGDEHLLPASVRKHVPEAISSLPARMQAPVKKEEPKQEEKKED